MELWGRGSFAIGQRGGSKTLPLLSSRHRAQMQTEPTLTKQNSYKPGPLDDILLSSFRQKMAQEVRWDSKKPGYDGMIEVARYLLNKHSSKVETEEATVRILKSLFPPFLLPLFRALVAPLFGGKPAAILTARVTQASCQWLMGKCSIIQVDLPDGSSLPTGVLVEKCKYLEESHCAGICMHTCKMPTQAFMKQHMGIPLSMEPNFQDFSCQFKFGIEAVPREHDNDLKTSCLDLCPTATIRKIYKQEIQSQVCPQIDSQRLL